MLKEIEKPGAGVVGARLLYPSGRLQHAGIVYLPRARRFDHEYRHRPGNYPPALETTEVLGVTGALMLVEKGFWDKLGGMDEQFFLSWEDVDFSLRAWAAGRRVLYTGQAYAVHPEGTTRANRKAASGLSGTRWTGRPKRVLAEMGQAFTSGWPDRSGGKIRFSRLQSAHWCKVPEEEVKKTGLNHAPSKPKKTRGYDEGSFCRVRSGIHDRFDHGIYQALKEDPEAGCAGLPQSFPALLHELRPEILLVAHGSKTPLNLVRYAHKLGSTTALWILEDPFEIDRHRGKMVESYDFVFTNERQAVKEYRRPRVFYLPFACNPHVSRPMAVPPKDHSDLCFVGIGFPNRLELFNSMVPFLKNLNVKLIGDWTRWENSTPS